MEVRERFSTIRTGVVSHSVRTRALDRAAVGPQRPRIRLQSLAATASISEDADQGRPHSAVTP